MYYVTSYLLCSANLSRHVETIGQILMVVPTGYLVAPRSVAGVRPAWCIVNTQASSAGSVC